MPVKINSVRFEKGKYLRKPKFHIKCYERRGGGIEKVYKTIGEVAQCLQHYYQNVHKLPCGSGCPFCIENAKEAKKKANGKAKPGGRKAVK